MSFTSMHAARRLLVAVSFHHQQASRFRNYLAESVGVAVAVEKDVRLTHGPRLYSSEDMTK